MARCSKIEWTDATWNVITGCTPISEGCQNCYARRMATRLSGRYGYPQGDPFRITFHQDRLSEPMKWKKPCRVFVCSMGDLFHADVTNNMLRAVFLRACSCCRHTFLFLTKRPKRMAQFIGGIGLPLPGNIWLGVTAENQARYDERWGFLSEISAAVKFVSIEPMLGPVSTCNFISTPDWVIAGPETGPGAREYKPEWIENLYAQCKVSGTPFFDKRETGQLAREWPRKGNHER